MNTVEKLIGALRGVMTRYEDEHESSGRIMELWPKESEQAFAALSAITEPTPEEMEFRAKFRTPDLESRASELHLAVILYSRRPARAYLAAIDAAILQKLGRSLATLAVKQCNSGLNESDERRWERLSQQAATVAAWYGLTVTAHGDPRGYVLRLHGDGIEKNGFGDGFGVA